MIIGDPNDPRVVGMQLAELQKEHKKALARDIAVAAIVAAIAKKAGVELQEVVQEIERLNPSQPLQLDVRAEARTMAEAILQQGRFTPQ